MFGLQWGERSELKSAHPLADPAAAAQLIRELPLDDPSSALAEAAAWLESIEAETFTPSHQHLARGQQRRRMRFTCRAEAASAAPAARGWIIEFRAV